jgi:hypothetical protein
MRGRTGPKSRSAVVCWAAARADGCKIVPRLTDPGRFDILRRVPTLVDRSTRIAANFSVVSADMAIEATRAMLA